MGANGNTASAEDLKGDRAGSRQRSGKTSGKVSAASGIIGAVITKIPGVIPVRRACQCLHRYVIGTMGIAVFDHDGKRCSGGFSLIHTRQKDRLIGFFPRGRKTVLSGTAPIGKSQQLFQIDLLAGRQTVDYNTDGCAVGLAKNRYFQLISPIRGHEQHLPKK